MIHDETKAAPPIWLVEDSPTTARMLSAMLSPLGGVRLFADGGSVLVALTTETPRVLVLDLHLPDVSGLEVCAQLRARLDRAMLPVLMITGENDADSLSTAFDVGANDFVSKPCRPEELRARVSSLLRQQNEHAGRETTARETRAARASAEQALGTAQSDARHRDTYIGILGHDLRNPLTAIRLGAEAIATVSADAAMHAITARIVRSADRMVVMVRDLLDFARGELASGIPIFPVPLDLAELAGRVTEELRPLYPRREIVLECRGELGGAFDKERLEQALSNLVGNALEHGDSVVRIELVREPDGVLVTVHNSGKPISAEDLVSLFEPFRHRPGKRTGLGLGMFIVKKVVEAHGGQIEVRSSAAEGTVSVLRLPIHPA